MGRTSEGVWPIEGEEVRLWISECGLRDVSESGKEGAPWHGTETTTRSGALWGGGNDLRAAISPMAKTGCHLDWALIDFLRRAARNPEGGV